jgi:hypothetical protein
MADTPSPVATEGERRMCIKCSIPVQSEQFLPECETCNRRLPVCIWCQTGEEIACPFSSECGMVKLQRVFRLQSPLHILTTPGASPIPLLSPWAAGPTSPTDTMPHDNTEAFSPIRRGNRLQARLGRPSECNIDVTVSPMSLSPGFSQLRSPEVSSM